MQSRRLTPRVSFPPNSLQRNAESDETTQHLYLFVIYFKRTLTRRKGYVSQIISVMWDVLYTTAQQDRVPSCTCPCLKPLPHRINVDRQPVYLNKKRLLIHITGFCVLLCYLFFFKMSLATSAGVHIHMKRNK